MLNIRDYHRPGTIDEAAALLRQGAAALGGGTWLAAEAPDAVSAVVDLSRLGLDSIRRDGPWLRLGATVTLQALVEAEHSSDLAGLAAAGLLKTTAHAMAALNIRNRATLAGAIVTADAASPLVAALLACDAELLIHADEPRSVALSGFLAYRQRLLAGGALITEVRFPAPAAGVRFAYQRVARTPRDYPIVCAVARCAVKDGIAGSVRVAVGGVAPTPIRLTALELGLEKRPLRQALDRELPPALAALSPAGDWLGSADYRRAMAGVLVRRAAEEIGDRREEEGGGRDQGER